MTKMIQIRNVSDDLHRKLKARAATTGLSLSDFIKREMHDVVERPTNEEIRQRLASLPPVRLKVSPAKLVREERDRRSR